MQLRSMRKLHSGTPGGAIHQGLRKQLRRVQKGPSTEVPAGHSIGSLLPLLVQQTTRSDLRDLRSQILPGMQTHEDSYQQHLFKEALLPNAGSRGSCWSGLPEVQATVGHGRRPVVPCLSVPRLLLRYEIGR